MFGTKTHDDNMIEKNIPNSPIPPGFVSSTYKGRYTLNDNLDTKNDPLIPGGNEYYNTQFTYNITVLRGTLKLVINKMNVEIKANETLIVRPFIRVKILESRCLLFGIIVQNELCNDTYEHCGISRDVQVRSFCFNHYRISAEQIETLSNDYRMLKNEMECPDYRMKELALRSLFSVYVAHMYSFYQNVNEIEHTTNNRNEFIYLKFLNMLSLYYRKERSVGFYAEKLNIAPKYLSTIVHHFTDYPASVVIDLYVVYRIKQTLYVNDMNIKSISTMYNFPNQSFFGRYFKRVTGMSPNEYIKQNNRKAIASD